MLIFPEIQIAGGRVITRSPGGETDIIHDISPAECLRWFESEGAERLHIVDVDAARGAARDNGDLIRDLIGTPSHDVNGDLRLLIDGGKDRWSWQADYQLIARTGDTRTS